MKVTTKIVSAYPLTIEHWVNDIQFDTYEEARRYANAQPEQKPEHSAKSWLDDYAYSAKRGWSTE